MKKKFFFQIQIAFIIVLFATFNRGLHGQNSKQDTIQTKSIELAQGCKLVLDKKINLSDTISIQIVDGIRDIIPRIQKLIPADSITINLAISSEYVLPIWGMGGRTIGDDTGERVEFYYDPKHPNFKVEFIMRSLAHELHHVCRIRNPQYRLTLLECMVNEGLAEHFMVEVFHCEQTPWSNALTEEEIKKNLIRVKPILRIKHEWTQEFNEKYFNPWMFGRSGDDPIPGWTGYSIGWKIVENYLKAHPEARASSLVSTSPEVIISSTPELMDLK